LPWILEYQIKTSNVIIYLTNY